MEVKLWAEEAEATVREGFQGSIGYEHPHGLFIANKILQSENRKLRQFNFVKTGFRDRFQLSNSFIEADNSGQCFRPMLDSEWIPFYLRRVDGVI